MGRMLTFKIFRYDAENPDMKPHMQDFVIEEEERMTLFVVLNKLREEQDGTLKFDFVCRAAICGSCAMLINGKPTLACKTLTKDLPDVTTLAPLPTFKMLGDLSVDTGQWFENMNIKTESWVHTEEPFDPDSEEDRMKNEEALRIYEGDRCIECGICIAGCGVANMRSDFLGAAGANKIARFMVDPRDERTDDDMYELFGNEEGIFGCVGLLACHENCPVGIPLQGQLAYVRKKMTMAGLRRK